MHAILAVMLMASTPQDRLADYIAKTNPQAAPYAKELALHMVVNSWMFRLDLSLFAAICQTESWFNRDTRGYHGEYGLWQILPDRNWRRMTTREQIHWSRHIPWATWHAAVILATVRKREHSPRSYAQYNSGYGPPKRSYVYRLQKYSVRIAEALNGG